MKTYKGIDLSKNEDMLSYIRTFHNNDVPLRDVFMESDLALQKMVTKCHFKKKAFIVAYNFSIWGFIATVLIILSGCSSLNVDTEKCTDEVDPSCNCKCYNMPDIIEDEANDVLP